MDRRAAGELDDRRRDARGAVLGADLFPAAAHDRETSVAGDVNDPLETIATLEGSAARG